MFRGNFTRGVGRREVTHGETCISRDVFTENGTKTFQVVPRVESRVLRERERLARHNEPVTSSDR